MSGQKTENRIKSTNGTCAQCKDEDVKVYRWQGLHTCAPCLDNSYSETNVKRYKHDPSWDKQPRTSTKRRVADKIGVNQNCPCGSKRKYKKCCKK